MPVFHRVVEDAGQHRVRRRAPSDGPRLADSSATHACHVGVADVGDARAGPPRRDVHAPAALVASGCRDGFMWPRWRSSHAGPSSPTVVRPIDGATYSPLRLADLDRGREQIGLALGSESALLRGAVVGCAVSRAGKAFRRLRNRIFQSLPSPMTSCSSALSRREIRPRR